MTQNRQFKLAILAVAFTASAPIAATVAESSTIVQGQTTGGDLIAFVGEFQPMQPFDLCKGEKNCWAFDQAYDAKYEVKQTLIGSLAIGPIVFEVFTHSGRVEVAEHRTAVIFVWKKTTGTYVMSKYSGVPVYRTQGGKWASCGMPKVEESEWDKVEKHLQEIEFAQDVILGNSSELTPSGVMNTFPADTYRIVNNDVHCHRGVYAEDFAPIMAAAIRKAAGTPDK